MGDDPVRLRMTAEAAGPTVSRSSPPTALLICVITERLAAYFTD
jgi:hypothetical protein